MPCQLTIVNNYNELMVLGGVLKVTEHLTNTCEQVANTEVFAWKAIGKVDNRMGNYVSLIKVKTSKPDNDL